MNRAALIFMATAAVAIPVIAAPPAGMSPLDQLQAKDVPVMLAFENRDLSEVIQTIGAAAGFEASFAKDFKDRKVTVGVPEKMSVKELLTKLATEQGLAYEVPTGKRLIVKDGRNGGPAA